VPIREYRCRSCEHRFEALVWGSEVPSCPRCSAEDPERLLSAFAVGAGRTAADAVPRACGRCGDPRGPGACGRD